MGKLKTIWQGTQANSILSCFIGKAVSGEKVTPEKALALSAYYACIKVISEDIAKLPVNVFKKETSRRISVDDHIVNDFFNLEACPIIGSTVFKMTMQHFALGWGGGFAEIQRDYSGKPVALWMIHPTRINAEIRGDQLYWKVVADPHTVEIPDRDMFHIYSFGKDGIQGYTPADIGRESLGLSLAEVKFGASFYGNGTNVGGVLEHPQKLSEQAWERLRKTFVTRYGGGADKAHKPAILEEGMKYTPLGVNPRDAQFIEGREFSVTEICRWFRMNPNKVQDLSRATFSNIEHQNIDHVKDTLLPWVTVWENEIKRKLFNRKSEKIFHVDLDLKTLMRGDSKAVVEYCKGMYYLGAMNSDEVREMEGRNPRGDEGGKEYVRQRNLVTDVERKAEIENAKQKASEQSIEKQPDKVQT
jgi:HK97 family phage portal protein